MPKLKRELTPEQIEYRRLYRIGWLYHTCRRPLDPTWHPAIQDGWSARIKAIAEGFVEAAREVGGIWADLMAA